MTPRPQRLPDRLESRTKQRMAKVRRLNSGRCLILHSFMCEKLRMIRRWRSGVCLDSIAIDVFVLVIDVAL